MGCLGRLLRALAVITWVAFMGAIVGGTAVPGTQHLAAPIVCPDRTTPPLVVVATSHPSAGKTSFTAQLVCFDAHGDPETPGQMRAILVLFAIYWTAALLLSAAIGLLMAAWRRVLRGGGPP